MEKDVQIYLEQFVAVCRDVLRERLVGLYLEGSLAQNDFRFPRSDIDIIGVCTEPLPDNVKDELVKNLRHESLAVPADGLEFGVVTTDTAKNPSPTPAYELSLSTGATWPEKVERSGTTVDLLIYFSICRNRGKTLYGPEPASVFGPIPPQWILNPLLEQLAWHKTKILDSFDDPRGDQAVLNACRAWRFAKEHILSSKSEGGEWVLAKEPDNQLVKEALAVRAGKRTDPLDGKAIETFLSRVLEICREAHLSE